MLILDARWRLGERGELFINGSLSESDAAFSALNLVIDPNTPQFVLDTYFPNGLPGPGEDVGSQLRFADYDLSHVHNYSDLEYVELRTSLGVNYKVSPAARLFSSISRFDLDDNQPYLQDASGSVTVIAGGVTWSF